MNRINITKALALMLCSLGLLLSCQKEQSEKVAKAVLGDQSIMTFAAKNPAAQTVTVYSDGPWHTTAPDWITVSPDTGDGVTSITVTASENADASGLLEPRKDTLIISGNTLASRLLIFVNQEGDAYRNAERITLDKVASLADGKAFVLDEATVMALTSTGYVLSNGKDNVYVKKDASAKLGDKVSVKGIKGSINGLPAVEQADEVTVKSSGSVTYPTPTNLNDILASYKGEQMDYVTVSGIVNGGALGITVEGTDYSIKQIDCPADLSISKLNGNRVELTGYACGPLGANMFGILTTAVKDNGPSVVPRPEKLLYAKWRFTTSLYPKYAEFFGGTDGVVDLTEGFSDLYVPSNVEGNGRITYYQVDKTATTPTSGNPKRIIGGTGHPYVTGAWPGDYWLFSATDNYEYPAGTNLHIKFLTRISATGQKYWMLEYFDGKDWQPAEEYPVETETETGTNARYNFINPTSNVAVECSWKLAAPCREPMFRMRCVANWQSNGKGALANPNGGTCRIADNDDDGEDAGPVFEVTDAPAGGGGGGGMKPGTVVFEEDFEWLEPYATGANAPDDITSNSVGSSPNIFTTAALQPILAELQNRGYAYIWGGKGMTEWATTEPDSGNGRTLYLQKNYLKFGKSDWSSGIVLPALSALTAAATVEVTFDWCWCMTGGSKPDIMTLTAEIQGGASEELSSTQPTDGDQTKLEWQHASVTFSGVTAESRISLHPTNVDPYVSNSARGQNRWYLDNIKIVTK
ncbi:MAG: BACON domain-containing protein [Bacteroidales bacterium]|nr:BACON domain-containing protein [Bacteroidales bacterium]